MSTRMKDVEMDTLGFEGAKETLHHSIVIAVAGAARADGNAMLSEEGLISVSGILAAAIRMMQESPFGLALR